MGNTIVGIQAARQAPTVDSARWPITHHYLLRLPNCPPVHAMQMAIDMALTRCDLGPVAERIRRGIVYARTGDRTDLDGEMLRQCEAT